MTREQTVRAFHHAAGHAIGVPWTADLIHFRLQLLYEEFNEVFAASNDVSLDCYRGRTPPPIRVITLLKELADLQYVLSGFAVTFGLNLNEAFNRVHDSNMTKFVDGAKRDDGKVLKGPHYVSPDLSDLS